MGDGFVLNVSKLKDGTLITTGYPGFYYSTDKGESWHESNEGFTACNAEAISFDSKGNIYTLDWSFFKSTDNGDTWTRKYIYENDYSEILVTKSDAIIIAGSSSHLKISRDGGETFQDPDVRIRNVQYITQISTGRIFAGGYSLHYSDDDGASWTKTTAIGTTYSLAENNEGHIFVAGTSGKIFSV